MMLNRLIGSALLVLSAAASAADQPSPARVQLDGFLAAFNSGDRVTIAAFERDHAPPGFTEATLQIFEKTGVLEILEVVDSSPHSLTSKVRESKTAAVARLSLEVDPAAPERIKNILLKEDDPDEDPIVRK